MRIRDGSSDVCSSELVPISAIRHDVIGRLDVLQGLIAWLFDENRRAAAAGMPLLRLAKKPFRFQASFVPLNAIDLDFLLACEHLENTTVERPVGTEFVSTCTSRWSPYH